MKIKNTTPANLSIMCTRSKATDESTYITVIGESTLELDDAMWKANKHHFKAQLDAGYLEVTEAPALSEAEVKAEEARALKAAEALIAKAKK